ncbi:MAG: F0F1 ATP synthase subunit B [Nitrospinota bacterium]|jgi:F-type H+-transporting ATPase subunit b|nr:F0F1 ATP synthase subunit B [Nitrospinota bacterium]
MPQFEQVSVFASLGFWSVVSFILLLVLLAKFAFPPILAMLEARENKITGDIRGAEDLKAEAEKLKRDFEAQLKTAHEKASTIVQLASEEARKIQEKTLDETQAKCRQMQKETEHEIQTSRNQILSEIRGYVSALTITSAEKILKRVLTEDDKKRLVDESIDEVVKSLEKQA